MRDIDHFLDDGPALTIRRYPAHAHHQALRAVDDSSYPEMAYINPETAPVNVEANTAASH
jgi:hypothetical protein